MAHVQWPEEPAATAEAECRKLEARLLAGRTLIIAANRGPYTLSRDENGDVVFQRGGGGLVTALIGLAREVEAIWIGSAMTETDREWRSGKIHLDEGEAAIRVEFVIPDPAAYDKYYNIIANPLLWFLQHSMWDFVRAPTIDKVTWDAWNNGYRTVNELFARAVARQVQESRQPPLVMFQDYHLYLAPRMVREQLGEQQATLTHFIHIPWPGSEDWGMMPPAMRFEILDGLCALDLLGFQTREDGLNFIRTCESHLPGAEVNFRAGAVHYLGHTTYVRDFPISIDVELLRAMIDDSEVEQNRRLFEERFGECQIILRVDRTEPSKNIVRGFHALDELLELYPEHQGKVQFLALLVPSRMEVEEYQSYLDELMAAAGRVNAKYGDAEWEPVRVMVGESYPRAVAAMQLYDVLLVNSIADGMNLVAKEGPTVNQKDGVVILSERTGARQQLEPGALVISPCDVHATALALHQALVMPQEERRRRAAFLRQAVEREDIYAWLCRQLETISELDL